MKTVTVAVTTVQSHAVPRASRQPVSGAPLLDGLLRALEVRLCPAGFR